jgi:hypothetical protein
MGKRQTSDKEANVTTLYKRMLFWAPRALAIAYIAFISMFALDVFSEGHGFWEILLALTMHLIPTFVLIVVLILAWRWEWVGTTFYAAAGLLYIIWVLQHPLSAAIKLLWILTIAGPVLLVAALFLANWLKHGELHTKHP